MTAPAASARSSPTVRAIHEKRGTLGRVLAAAVFATTTTASGPLRLIPCMLSARAHEMRDRLMRLTAVRDQVAPSSEPRSATTRMLKSSPTIARVSASARSRLSAS